MIARSGIWAVVPVKNFDAAKTRLADVLRPGERSLLSRVMLKDVLAALSGSDRLAGTVVVTADDDAAGIAVAAGARVFWETATGGPATAVTDAARQLARSAQAGIIGIMADVPLVTSDEIDQLLALHAESPAVTLVPSLDGTGTNAVVCTPPDIMKLSFGENSLATHLQSAKRQAIRSNIVDLPGLGLDLDRPADLQLFLHRRSATRTSRYLDKLDIKKRCPAPTRAPAPGAASLQRASR